VCMFDSELDFFVKLMCRPGITAPLCYDTGDFYHDIRVNSYIATGNLCHVATLTTDTPIVSSLSSFADSAFTIPKTAFTNGQKTYFQFNAKLGPATGTTGFDGTLNFGRFTVTDISYTHLVGTESVRALLTANVTSPLAESNDFAVLQNDACPATTCDTSFNFVDSVAPSNAAGTDFDTPSDSSTHLFFAPPTTPVTVRFSASGTIYYADGSSSEMKVSRSVTRQSSTGSSDTVSANAAYSVVPSTSSSSSSSSSSTGSSDTGSASSFSVRVSGVATTSFSVLSVFALFMVILSLFY
jgi:hypothetical protein